MRRLSILLACFVAACAPFEPRPDPYTGLEPISTQSVAEPVKTPDFPTMQAEDGRAVLILEDERIGSLTPAGARWLSEVDIAAHGNEEIARAHTEALRASQRERDALLDSARAEHELAELRGRMLAEERRARLLDKLLWGSAGVLGLLIGLQ